MRFCNTWGTGYVNLLTLNVVRVEDEKLYEARWFFCLFVLGFGITGQR